MLKPSALLDHLAAGCDLQAGDVDRVDLPEHRLPGVVGQQVCPLGVVDRREGGVPIFRNLQRTLSVRTG